MINIILTQKHGSGIENLIKTIECNLKLNAF